MGGRKSRRKGQVGERQFFKLSNEAVADLDYPYRNEKGEVFFRHPLPRHGHGQTDNSDPHGVLPLAIEVKYVDTPQFTRWINKLRDPDETMAREHQTRVLAWRPAHGEWLVMPLMDENEWKEYLRWRLSNGS